MLGRERWSWTQKRVMWPIGPHTAHALLLFSLNLHLSSSQAYSWVVDKKNHASMSTSEDGS